MDVEISGGSPLSEEEIRNILLEEGHKAMRVALATVEAEWRSRLVPNVRGYRTGTYSRSITNDGGRVINNRVEGSVGTALKYGRYLEYGTGLYGPRNRWITPVRAKALRFPEPGNAGFTLAGRRRRGRAGALAKYIYAARVRGIKPRRYGRDAVLISEPKVRKIFERFGEIAARRISAGK